MSRHVDALPAQPALLRLPLRRQHRPGLQRSLLSPLPKRTPRPDPRRRRPPSTPRAAPPHRRGTPVDVPCRSLKWCLSSAAVRGCQRPPFVSTESLGCREHLVGAHALCMGRDRSEVPNRVRHHPRAERKVPSLQAAGRRRPAGSLSVPYLGLLPLRSARSMRPSTGSARWSSKLSTSSPVTCSASSACHSRSRARRASRVISRCSALRAL